MTAPAPAGRGVPRPRGAGPVLSRLALLGAILALGCWSRGLAAEPADLLRQIRTTTLDPQRAVSLKSVELELGLAGLRVESGVLIPTRPIDGRTVELVFVGRARFQIEPPDEIEAGQLELFTAQRSVDTPVEAAVLVVVDQKIQAELLARPPVQDISPAILQRAEGLLRDWLKRAERRTTGVEAAIFKSLVGDVAFGDYFALWCRSSELGDLVFQLDPEDVEQLTLGSFIPIEVKGWERRRLQRHIRIQQRKGRWLGLRVEDLGAWDVWLSTAWAPSDRPALPGEVGFETEHYRLDVRILRRSLKLQGTARLEITAQSDGRRTLPLRIQRDLTIRSVRDRQGRELFFFRSGTDVVVVLPEPSVAGRRLALEVTYGGRALKWVGPKTFDLENTSAWYPHCGTVDRATYDVTLHWPARYDLLASGRAVDGGRQGKYSWQRRTLDVPAIAFSFALGEFALEKRRVGETDLTVAFNRGSRSRLTEGLRRRSVDTIAEALDYFQQAFGQYPLDELTVVTLPRRYSQSYLGFVTLADSILSGEGQLGDRTWIRDTTIAHEIAHQWWGNLVGWYSYRDQWLSEAMANYSGLRFYADTHEEGHTFLADMSAGWRESLSRTTIDGRTVESLGPIVLGGRLNSSRAGRGYNAIVYRKGAVVLAMMARAVGEERFLSMLSSLVEAAANRVLTTETFIQAVERMSGLEMDGFARQFIYGTGIPQVYYDYESMPDGSGAWKLSGEARRLAAHRFAHRIVRSQSGRWEAVREVQLEADEDSTVLMVPFRLSTDADGDAGRQGSLFLEGKRAGFEIDSDRRPEELRLDPNEEILARFYSAARHPKRMAHFRGRELALEGRSAEAETQLRRALELELGDSEELPAIPWMRDARRQALVHNAKIRLDLARLYLEQRRDAEARRELKRVDELLATDQTFRMQRDVLWSRLEMRQCDHAAAFKRLRRILKRASPEGGARSWRTFLWRLQLSTERDAVTEAFVLLAIAAFETGNAEVKRWAVERAKERGADVSLFETLAARLNP